MTNKCARCGKTVYPTEELKCLDKLWHKVCFRCDECGMALSMTNYKGFNKTPYCNTHYPHMKPTNVTETPESRRLAENTRLQSQVKYHEDFERAKGKVTQVADDPETVRILNAHRIISNAAYHGDLERKKQMEEKRVLVQSLDGNIATISQDTNGQIDPQRQAVNHPRIHQPPQASVPALLTPAGNRSQAVASAETRKQPQQQRQVRGSYESDARKVIPTGSFASDHNDNRRHQSQQQRVESSQLQDNPVFVRSPSAVINSSGPKASPGRESSRKVGSIADYDPLNDNYGSIASGYRAPEPTFAYFGAASSSQQPQHLPNMQQQQEYYLQQQHFKQQHQLQQQIHRQQLYQQQLQQQQLQQQQLHMQPQCVQQLQQRQHFQQHQQPLQQQMHQIQNHQKQQQPQIAYQPAVGVVNVRQGAACTVRAIYDYKAQDDDEVSFMDGDLIIGCVPIDEGWMTGTVQRTGQRGMLPSNYVESSPS